MIEFYEARAVTAARVAEDGEIVAPWAFAFDDRFIMVVGPPSYIDNGDVSELAIDDEVLVFDRRTGKISEELVGPDSDIAKRSGELDLVGDADAYQRWQQLRDR